MKQGKFGKRKAVDRSLSQSLAGSKKQSSMLKVKFGDNEKSEDLGPKKKIPRLADQSSGSGSSSDDEGKINAMLGSDDSSEDFADDVYGSSGGSFVEESGGSTDDDAEKSEKASSDVTSGDVKPVKKSEEKKVTFNGAVSQISRKSDEHKSDERKSLPEEKPNAKEVKSVGMEAAIDKILSENARSLAKTILKTIGGEEIAVSSTPETEVKKAAQVTSEGILKKRTVADTPLPKSTLGSVPAGVGTKKKKNRKRKKNGQAQNNGGGKQ